MNSLVMRRAVMDDAARVMDIIEDGKRSIARFGIDQWQCGYPNIDSVASDIELNSCYVAEDDKGTALGTLALLEGHDLEYESADLPWLTSNGKAAEAPTYAAIHRCATAQAALNRGIMAFMFSKATELAKRVGKTSLRIDTHPGNAAMRSFLTKQGFQEIGPFSLQSDGRTESDLTRIAYEKLI